MKFIYVSVHENVVGTVRLRSLLTLDDLKILRPSTVRNLRNVIDSSVTLVKGDRRVSDTEDTRFNYFSELSSWTHRGPGLRVN